MNILTETTCEKVLKYAGYGKVIEKDYSPGGKKVYFRVKSVLNRRQLLEDITQVFQNHDFNAQYIKTQTFSSQGHISCDNIIIMVKPLSGPTENLRLKGAGLAVYGTVEYLTLMGQENVKCFTFKSPKEIANSVLLSLKDNEKHIPIEIYNSFKRYVRRKDPTQMTWDDNISQSDMCELGKNAGEMLVGYLGMFGCLSIPKAKKFIVPASASFPCCDSALLAGNNKMFVVSSKFGEGAAASFFSNILGPAKKIDPKITKKAPVLSKILKCGNYDDPIKIIYEYGIKHVLGINTVDDPYNVYMELRLGADGSDSRKVIAAIKKQTTNPHILKYLTEEYNYSSVTGYFTREIARDLNGCPKSIALMKDVLAAKEFYQSNLNIPKWMEGTIEFKFSHSGNIELKLDGRKASLMDISSQSGKICYILRAQKST
jgi:hypothetical protein